MLLDLVDLLAEKTSQLTRMRRQHHGTRSLLDPMWLAREDADRVGIDDQRNAAFTDNLARDGESILVARHA